MSLSNIQSSLSHYADWAKSIAREKGSRAASLFQTYVAKPLEKIAIGDLRTFDLSDFTYSEEYDRAKGFGYHSFGLFGGIALWQPNSQKELAKVLNELDQQPSARSSYQSGAALLNAPFLLADTSSSAIPHRKELIPFLRPEKYTAIAWDLWKQSNKGSEDLSIEEIFQVIAMKAVAKGMLGIELTDAQIKGFSELGRDFKRHSASLLPAALLKFAPEFKSDEAKCQKLVEDLLKEEIEKIQKDLGEATKNPGMLVQEICKILQRDPDRKNIHQDPELKSMLAILIAVDNLHLTIGTLETRLRKMCQGESGGLRPLEQEIGDSGVLQENGVDPVVLFDKKKMPLLDALYREALEDTFEHINIAVRYAQKGVQCGEHYVPSRSYLLVQSSKRMVEEELRIRPFSVFSEGTRSCPGRRVAEAVIKTLAVGCIQDQEHQKQLDRHRAADLAIMIGIRLREYFEEMGEHPDRKEQAQKTLIASIGSSIDCYDSTEKQLELALEFAIKFQSHDQERQAKTKKVLEEMQPRIQDCWYNVTAKKIAEESLALLKTTTVRYEGVDEIRVGDFSIVRKICGYLGDP